MRIALGFKWILPFSLIWIAATSIPAAGQNAGPNGATLTPGSDAPTLSPDYQLVPGDVVDVEFFYNSELNQKVQIRPDGRISLRLVGDVELARKTVPEAVRDLEVAYRRILKTPSISLQIAGYASQKVYVGGEVLRAGAVNMPGDLTVLQAVMEVGGLAHSASSSIILIRRDDKGAPYVKKLSLKNVNGGPSEAAETRLRPFDVILVPEKRVAKMNRWVDEYMRRMSPAILTAGFSYLANANFLP